MPQAAATSAPSVPTPPQQPTSNIGDVVRGAVNDAVAGALAGTRAELAARIANLEARRAQLTGAIAGAESRQARRALQSELDQVDGELAKTQSALDRLNQKITTTDGPRIYTGTGTPPQLPNFPMDRFNPAPMIISIMAILFIGFPIALTLSRWLWKRSTAAPAPPLSVEQGRRFDRLEQSMDAIAIEVERISENQRYLTKLLAEPKQNAKIGS